jgi:DNA-binding NtrC family response regulator
LLLFYDVSELYQLRGSLSNDHGPHMIGTSQPMLRLYQLIEDTARGDWTVLIEGETGTGKELVARSIHTASPRHKGPFIAVNSAGLSESLLSSQLFGHRRGAFTGALADQEGVFEAANGGTLFLDEIGDLPLNMQASLLRVLDQREIVRVGEARPRKVDVRIIAATHKALTTEVQAGRFREDLLFRLRVARIAVPPLRQRQPDIPLLVQAFLHESRQAAGKIITQVSSKAMQYLLDYPWPGNVRELKSCIDYAVIQSRGPVLQPDHLPPEIGKPAAPGSIHSAKSDADERSQLLQALEQTRGNRTRAAGLLGISRATFYRRLIELGISSAK